MIEKKLIERRLKANFFGEYLYIFEEIDSTNNYARKLAAEGAPEGTVVIADYQSAGRGRFNRKWESERAKNILLSIILRPKLDIDTVQRITLAAADVLIHTLSSQLKKSVSDVPDFHVKWPNDVMVGDKKIAGILTESSIRDKNIDFAVVGIGVNVNQDTQSLQSNIDEQVTSLLAETGQKFEREFLIASILNHFEKSYSHLERTNYSSVILDWKKHCKQFGHAIVVETAVGTVSGVFHDVNEKGMLVYAKADGSLKELVSGRILGKQV